MPTTRIIAVTGATGHLGNVVCRQLCEQGFRVRALARTDTRALDGLPLDVVQGDVLDPASLDRLLVDCDAVVHCAAIISVHGDPDGRVFKTNTEGTANVLQAAVRTGIRRMVHVSSVHAVEELPHALPFDESRPYKKAGAYAYDYSKAVGEQILLASTEKRPEIVIVRPSAILGPFDFKPSELGKAMLDFQSRKIPALPQGGYNFVDVRDVARSVVRAIDAGRPGEVYLLTGVYYTLREFAKKVEAVSGVKTTRLVIPYFLLRILVPFFDIWARLRGTKPLFSLETIDAVKHGHPAMDNRKATLELNHACRPLEESIRDFYDWHKEQNHDPVHV